MKRISHLLAAAVSACLLVVGLTACASPSTQTPDNVAATVGSSSISEDAVTDYIQTFRTASELTDDEAWANWMTLNGYTAEDVRSQAIDVLASQELLEQAAEEMDITITDEEMAAALEAIKTNYGSEEAWASVLESLALSEEEYVEQRLRPSLLQQKIAVQVGGSAVADDSAVLGFVQENASLFNGARESRSILFDSADEATARSVWAALTNGSLDFAEAATQYSLDASAPAGGYRGWDILDVPNSEYAQALQGMVKGQISDLVVTPAGIEIIQCTDVLEAPEDGFTSLDQLPQTLVDEVRTMTNDGAAGQAYYAWYADYSKDKVTTNPMPSGLPYDVSQS